MNIADLIAANASRWKVAGYATKPLAQAILVAKRLTSPAAKAVYVELAQTGVPWALIAVIHEREASQKLGLFARPGRSLGPRER